MIVVFCGLPYSLRIVNQHIVCHVFFRRNAGKLAVLPAQKPRCPTVVGLQSINIFFKILQKLFILRIGQKVIACLGQNGHGLSSAFKAVFWRSGAGVQIQYAHGVIVRR